MNLYIHGTCDAGVLNRRGRGARASREGLSVVGWGGVWALDARPHLVHEAVREVLDGVECGHAAEHAAQRAWSRVKVSLLKR